MKSITFFNRKGREERRKDPKDIILKCPGMTIVITLVFVTVLLISLDGFSQKLEVNDPYLQISAKAKDPLYTTYAASMERSRLYGDKAYKMHYYADCDPLNYTTDQGGTFFNVWMINKLVIDRIEKFYKKPIVTASFADMAIIEYEPFDGIQVQECFFVYSSSLTLSKIHIKNTSGQVQLVEVFPVFDLGNDSLDIQEFSEETFGYITHHFESKERLISNLYANAPYPTHCRDFFGGSERPYSYGGFNGGSEDFYNYIKTDFYEENRSQDSLNFRDSGLVDFVSLHYQYKLGPGESRELTVFRGQQGQDEESSELIEEIEEFKRQDLQKKCNENINMFQSVPRIEFQDESDKLVYLSAFNLVRGCMLPPTENTSHNFYVFSRNPIWGWGHGHQVLHESLSMLSYVYLDPESAMESQRVYMEQQGPDGLIAYRHGPRGLQDYPHKDEPTTSAPFFSWINWEIYQVAKDKIFLEEAYHSGVKYMNWLLEHRDTDKDGTFEWGPYGIIENVRDWYNAVFQVSAERYLDIDKEDISDELECLDLTLMVINEMHCLANMAMELGLTNEVDGWSTKAALTAELVNEIMWEPEHHFYYHVDKEDHNFHFMERDLRRQEIIGFLPLWAEAVEMDRAALLIPALTDTNRFWRKYGIPTLAANDEWYSPYVDYCCKWNGPVWLLWDYMVFKGLNNYGYDELANELADKMMLAVKTQLSKNHNFWESYSPDNEVLDCPPNYIWDSIVAKLLIEAHE